MDRTPPKLVIPEDAADRFVLALSGDVAYDAATGVRLVRSDGRRRSGRKRLYWLSGTGRDRAPQRTAATSEEALTWANEWLAKNWS